MDFSTLIVTEIPHGIAVTLNRLEQRNSLNSVLMNELQQLLTQAEKNPAYKIIVLRGQEGIFCTGMDFKEMTQAPLEGEGSNRAALAYMSLLKRFASSSKVVIAEVDGQVMAGGVGFVAASDIAIATPRSQFTLSEALWGLLPANVLPYLIRRIGFQKAYTMTLTSQTMTAAEAHAVHLVDELSDNTADSLRKLSLRLGRLNEQTIVDLKNYFRKMWIIDDRMEEVAMLELARLIGEPRVQKNIKCFVEQGKFPWEVSNE